MVKCLTFTHVTYALHNTHCAHYIVSLEQKRAQQYTCIVLIKMFLRWFFANKKTNVLSTALKLCGLTEDVMT